MSSLFCGVCGKTGDVQVCTGCEEVYYCGRECQLKDWPTHKVRCKQMQARRKAEAELQRRREEAAAAAAAAAASTSTTPSTTTATPQTPQPTYPLPKPAASTSTLSVSSSGSPSPGLPSSSASASTLSVSTSAVAGSSPSPTPSYQAQQGRGGGNALSASTPSPAPSQSQSQSRMDKFTSFMKKKGDSAKKGLESFKDTVGEKTRKLKSSGHEDAAAAGGAAAGAAGGPNAAANAAAASSVAATNATMDQLLAPPKPGDPHAVFGVPFETAIERSATTIQGVPDIIVYALSYLEKSGLDEEGLFRLSGSLREIAKLRGTFQSGEIPPIDAVGDPHVITGLLKLYFRELPEPLFEKKMENPPKSDPARGIYRPLFDSVYDEFKKPIQLLFWFLHKVKRNSLFIYFYLLF